MSTFVYVFITVLISAPAFAGESLFDAAKAGHLEAALTPMLPQESTAPDDRRAFFHAAESAEAAYLDYLRRDLLPRARSSTPEELTGVGKSLGLFEMLSKTACNAQKLPELRTSDLCKALGAVQGMFADLERAAKPPTCGDTGNMATCMEETLRMMAGTSRVQDWWTWPAQRWHLNQVLDGNVIYVSENHSEFLVAVRQASIKAALNPGMTLAASVRCVKFISDTKITNLQGFQVPVKLYDSVPCEAK